MNEIPMMKNKENYIERYVTHLKKESLNSSESI